MSDTVQDRVAVVKAAIEAAKQFDPSDGVTWRDLIPVHTPTMYNFHVETTSGANCQINQGQRVTATRTG
jgi:hypothetical protein